MTLLERIQNSPDEARVEFPLPNGMESFRVGELKGLLKQVDSDNGEFYEQSTSESELSGN